jgi:hypothetical protein
VVERAFPGSCHREEASAEDSPTSRRTCFKEELDAFHALADPENDRVHVVPAALRVGYELIEELSVDERPRIFVNPYIQQRRTVHLLHARGPSEESASKARSFVAAFDTVLGRLVEDGTVAAIERRQRFGPRSRIVRLTNPGSVPMIFGRLEPDAERVVVLPRGTRAHIEEWGDAFVVPAETSLYEELYKKTQVTILNGPFAGRKLWVDNLFIEIPED